MVKYAQIIAVAIAEITKPMFGVTEEFLKVHSVAHQNGSPQVAGVKKDGEDGQTVVYFTVEGEKFYLAIHLNTVPEIEVNGVDTEDYYRVSFRAYSEKLTFQELSDLTPLKPTCGYSKGDQRSFGGGRYPGNLLEFYLNPQPTTFESKLDELLTFLEQDARGIRVLCECAESYISVVAIFHNGNTMLGGVHLDKSMIQRMSALNLEIDFDLYAEGNFYKS